MQSAIARGHEYLLVEGGRGSEHAGMLNPSPLTEILIFKENVEFLLCFM